MNNIFIKQTERKTRIIRSGVFNFDTCMKVMRHSWLRKKKTNEKIVDVLFETLTM